MAEPIESEERFGKVGLLQGPPPREFCVTVREVDEGRTKRTYHTDFIVQNNDRDGKFRAEVGEALSRILEESNG